MYTLTFAVIPCTDVMWYLIFEVLTYSHVLKLIISTCCKLPSKNQLLFCHHGERFAVNAYEIVLGSKLDFALTFVQGTRTYDATKVTSQKDKQLK